MPRVWHPKSTLVLPSESLLQASPKPHFGWFPREFLQQLQSTRRIFLLPLKTTLSFIIVDKSSQEVPSAKFLHCSPSSKLQVLPTIEHLSRHSVSKRLIFFIRTEVLINLRTFSLKNNACDRRIRLRINYAAFKNIRCCRERTLTN